MHSSNQLKKISESEFLRQVIEYARLRGFRCAHFRPGRTKDGGWKTAVVADGAGFFDLCMMHPTTGKLVFAELKVGNNKLSASQQEWFDTAIMCARQSNSVFVELWTPADWERIEEALR